MMVALTHFTFESLPHPIKWELYRDTRQGTYEFRQGRYGAVIAKLFQMGLQDNDQILDIGAGECQFGRFLREKFGWRGLYTPVDAVLDGVDLNTWSVPKNVDWIVCIEVVEHLTNPLRTLAQIKSQAMKGAVITTPNPAAVDVLMCDPTHVSQVSINQFHQRGWRTETRNLFGTDRDTIIAHIDKRRR